MTDTTFEPSLRLTLAHEGGYVNHPKDPGGATNFGVIQRTYDSYRRLNGLPVRSVRRITQTEVREIYRRNYWNAAGCNVMPAGVDYAVFDYAVNSGPGRSIKDLQRTVNDFAKNHPSIRTVNVDGDIGPATLSAVQECAAIDEVAFIELFCNRRMKFLRSLKTYSTFGKGWQRRVLGDKPNPTADEGDHGVIDYAVEMAKDDKGKPAGLVPVPVAEAALPTPIGDKPGEVNGKGNEGDKAVTKSKEGIGTIAASLGVSGATAMQAAEEVKPHIGDGTFGTIAAVVFGLLMLIGVALVVYKFIEKRREQNAS